jgi:hypothetical protein
VWHASVSLQKKQKFSTDDDRLQRIAIPALEGVGGEREWWVLKTNDVTDEGWVGHLRVNVTPEENALIPPGLVWTDAGATGPERPRTYLRGQGAARR